MNDTSPQSSSSSASPARRSVERVGQMVQGVPTRVRESVEFLGGLLLLLGQTLRWTHRSMTSRQVRFRHAALLAQMVRVGVQAIGIIVVVQGFIGIILALQVAPPLRAYGQTSHVADIIGIAIFRELGPLITAVVLSGFAGAAITAEIGAMVESEEIKALRATALNPVHFLVVPRVLATCVMMIFLTVLADVVGVLGGMGTSVWALGVEPSVYLSNTQNAVVMKDFLTGLFKAGVFGVLISVIACYKGLTVSGGAEGVGRATTQTVVLCILLLIAVDCLFTTVFYILGW